MKKILFMVGLVAITGLTRATTISSGITTLDGNSAYSWGISIPLASGQVVTSVEIDFTGVSLTAANTSGTGYLYTDLLNSQHTAVTTATDNDASGDYWATKYSGNNIASLGTQFFAYVGKTLTWSYVLDSTQLATLNSYLTAGSFSIGFSTGLPLYRGFHFHHLYLEHAKKRCSRCGHHGVLVDHRIGRRGSFPPPDRWSQSLIFSASLSENKNR